MLDEEREGGGLRQGDGVPSELYLTADVVCAVCTALHEVDRSRGLLREEHIAGGIYCRGMRDGMGNEVCRAGAEMSKGFVPAVLQHDLDTQPALLLQLLGELVDSACELSALHFSTTAVACEEAKCALLAYLGVVALDEWERGRLFACLDLTSQVEEHSDGEEEQEGIYPEAGIRAELSHRRRVSC